MNELLKGIRAVVFDAGNTLTHPDWQRVTAQTEKHFALRCDETSLQRSICKVLREADGDVDFLRSLARKSIPANWHFRRVYGDLGLDEAQQAQLSSVLDALHAERHLWTALNEEAVPVLEELKRRELRLGVVSNSEDGRVAELLRTIDIFHFFDACIDSHLVEYAKPDSRIFLHAVNQLGVEPREAIYVGDSYTQDISGAREAGLRAVLYDPLDLQPQANTLRIHSLTELISSSMKQQY